MAPYWSARPVQCGRLGQDQVLHHSTSIRDTRPTVLQGRPRRPQHIIDIDADPSSFTLSSLLFFCSRRVAIETAPRIYLCASTNTCPPLHCLKQTASSLIVTAQIPAIYPWRRCLSHPPSFTLCLPPSNPWGSYVLSTQTSPVITHLTSSPHCSRSFPAALPVPSPLTSSRPSTALFSRLFPMPSSLRYPMPSSRPYPVTSLRSQSTLSPLPSPLPSTYPFSLPPARSSPVTFARTFTLPSTSPSTLRRGHPLCLRR